VHTSYCKGCLDKELARIPILGGNLDPSEKMLADFSLVRYFPGQTFPIYLTNLLCEYIACTRADHLRGERGVLLAHLAGQNQYHEDESERGRALVSSAGGWRAEMAKWISEARGLNSRRATAARRERMWSQTIDSAGTRYGSGNH
jgi:hypothetical protein